MRPYDAHFAVSRWREKNNLLSQVKCPVLFLSGDKDVFFTHEKFEAGTKAFPNSQAAIIEGAGAMICYEKPKEWSQAVLSFLQSQ